MADETTIAAGTVAEVIAEQAAEIVAADNDAAEEAHAVTEAVVAAAVEDARVRRVEEIEKDLRDALANMATVVARSDERVSECERQIKTSLETLATLQALQSAATTAAILDTSLNQAPSPHQSPANEGEAAREAVEPAQAETPPPPPPPESRRRKTRLI
jgi:hypothetical protein